MMKIKICGIQEAGHAVRIARMGVDLLGFVFAPSPRRVTPEKAREIIGQLPPGISTVGVFVDEDPQVVNSTAAFCGLDMVQLHGGEDPAYCRGISCPVIKAFRVKDSSSLKDLLPYRGHVEFFLLDTYIKGQAGGTDKTFDWFVAKEGGVYGPVILAGGLSPDNVTTAIRQAQPFGVDVSSGVETDGVKDLTKIKAFIRQARGSDNVHITG